MYEIEIMLGATDESHIIRSIEYWDIEKRRFPSREHKAVLVAESITNRFFNVISLISKSIPVIAIQVSAIRHGDNVFLNFVKVLDIYETPDDLESVGEPVSRSYWEKKSHSKSMELMDNVINIIKQKEDDPRITFNRHHVAVGNQLQNFMWIRPRKTAGYCHTEVLVGKENMEKVKGIYETLGMTYTVRKDNLISISLITKDFEANKEELSEIFLEGLAKVS